jgi:hypothetical protein
MRISASIHILPFQKVLGDQTRNTLGPRLDAAAAGEFLETWLGMIYSALPSQRAVRQVIQESKI